LAPLPSSGNSFATQEQRLEIQNNTGQVFESERKNVTVLFADISGFTSMSEKLDPEDVTTLMNDCLKIMADIVIKYEGYVDKFIGDCIMAIFGAPITHENDPELAVRAALDMKREIAEFNKGLPVKLEKPLTLHIGINSGIVIAGGVGSDKKLDYTVMGDTVNLASRLESIAGASQIFVSSYTYNLTRDLFDFVRHEPIKVKGKKDPVAVYEAVNEKSLKEQDRKGDIAAVPLVGRSQEIELLKKCAQKFMVGQGQAVFLVSDQGFGKSRIQAEVKKYFEKGQVQIIQGICHSFNRSTSYYVFSEIFKELFNIDSEDLEELVAEKIVKNLPLLLNIRPEALDPEARKAIVFIGAIMDVQLGGEFDIPVSHMEAQEIKISTFRAVSWFFERMSKSKPLLLILDNLHHADSTSVELIAYLFDALKNLPVMLLLLMRPWKDHPSYKLPLIAKKTLEDCSIEITFKNLNSSECIEFIQYFLNTDHVPEVILRLVQTRADGNPLYIEEHAYPVVSGR